MQKKEIKIKFVDFWTGFDYKYTIFHQILDKKYEIVISEEPDYIICSCFDEKYKQYDCIRIFYSGENYSTNFNEYDYGIDFDDYVLQDRHIRFPNYFLFLHNKYTIDLLKTKHTDVQKKFNEKDSFCSFVYSHEVNLRNYFYNELSKYKHIDSGGVIFNNCNLGPSSQEKLSFESKHKFSIAFENSSRPGYITEKLVDSFAAATVPIYYGASDVTKYFNPKAMLILDDKKHVPELIEKIKEIDNNDELYLQMLSEPAINPEYKEFFDNYEKNLEDFLYNIFDQPLENARRRTTFKRWFELYPRKKSFVDKIKDILK